MVELTKKLREGASWLAKNGNTRNSLIYGATLVINPLGNSLRGALGLAGKAYQRFFNEDYEGKAYAVNVARLGLAAVTVLDAISGGGLNVETLGDVLLTSALITDTDYWERRSLKGIGEDVKKLGLRKRAEGLSDRINRDR